MNSKTTSASKFLVIILFLTVFGITANAQKKKPATTRKPAASTSVSNSLEIKNGAEKVSTQIKNVSKFLFILGGVAKDIEAIDADIRARKITRQTTIDQNSRDRQSVVTAILNLRSGLLALENEFRTKPGLRLYAVRVEGVSNLAADAEMQANGGRLSESGKTLLLVVERLSDALAALP